ncbi:hypothetical protein MMC06_006368 [Schaereria dolodes]|nr:hypothetical protein [Schaereria dolodes]
MRGPGSTIGLIQLLVTLHTTSASTIKGPRNAQAADSTSAGTMVPRTVYAIADNLPDPWAVLGGSSGADAMMSTHMSMHIAGNTNDGPLRLTMKKQNGTVGFDAIDWGIKHSSDPLNLQAQAGRVSNLVEIGTWVGANKDIIDATTGKGILQEAAKSILPYKTGSSGCAQLFAALAKSLNIALPPQLTKLIGVSGAVLAAIGATSEVVASPPLRLSTVLDFNSPTMARTLWSFADPDNPFLVTPANAQVDTSGDLEDEADHIPNTDKPLPVAQPIQETTGDLVKPFSSNDLVESKGGSTGTDGGGQYILARANQAKSLISMTTQDVAGKLGIAGMAAAPVFIILDFADGNWVGGAIALAGLIVGAAELAFVSAGPVGWLIDGIITTFFALLPKLFEKPKPKPLNYNATQIIQYSMFGDALHTGNEQCQKQNPSCQAVYGPGVISSVFDWEPFDAVIFMIAFNQGFTMTIPDMGAAFEIATNTSDADPNAIATIQCNDPQDANAFIGPHGVGSEVQLWGDTCKSASYSINRSLVTLPNLNVTADQIYPRISNGTNGGDCAIMSAALTGVNFPDYNYTLLNNPVSIVCGIDDAINFGGMAVAVGNFNTSLTPVLISPSNESTDGNAGEHTAADAITPFVPLLNETSSVCFTGNNNLYLCLPNGTYQAQTGKFGFNTNDINAFTVPPAGGSLTIYITEEYYMKSGQKHSGRTHSNTWTASIATNANKGFDMAMQQLQGEMTYGQFDVLTPNQPAVPGACLFSDTQYQGDVTCLGPGGGPLPSSLVNATSSMTIFGGATVKIYATAYGDNAGASLSAATPDFGQVLLGNNPLSEGGFANKVGFIEISTSS